MRSRLCLFSTNASQHDSAARRQAEAETMQTRGTDSRRKQAPGAICRGFLKEARVNKRSAPFPAGDATSIARNREGVEARNHPAAKKDACGFPSDLPGNCEHCPGGPYHAGKSLCAAFHLEKGSEANGKVTCGSQEGFGYRVRSSSAFRFRRGCSGQPFRVRERNTVVIGSSSGAWLHMCDTYKKKCLHTVGHHALVLHISRQQK